MSQTLNGATTNFQIDPTGLGDVVAAFSGTAPYNNSGGVLAHYTYGLGLTSQVSPAGSAGYYDFSLTGNTIGITSAAGTYANKYAYLPFGQTIPLATALANPFTFVGQFGVMNDGSGGFAMGDVTTVPPQDDSWPLIRWDWLAATPTHAATSPTIPSIPLIRWGYLPSRFCGFSPARESGSWWGMRKMSRKP